MYQKDLKSIILWDQNFSLWSWISKGKWKSPGWGQDKKINMTFLDYTILIYPENLKWTSFKESVSNSVYLAMLRGWQMFLPYSVETDSLLDWQLSLWQNGLGQTWIWRKAEHHNTQFSANWVAPEQVQATLQQIQLHGNKTKALPDSSPLKLRKATVRLTFTCWKFKNMDYKAFYLVFPNGL